MNEDFFFTGKAWQNFPGIIRLMTGGLVTSVPVCSKLAAHHVHRAGNNGAAGPCPAPCDRCSTTPFEPCNADNHQTLRLFAIFDDEFTSTSSLTLTGGWRLGSHAVHHMPAGQAPLTTPRGAMPPAAARSPLRAVMTRCARRARTHLGAQLKA